MSTLKDLNSKIVSKIDKICRLFSTVENMSNSIAGLSEDKYRSCTHYALTLATLKGEDDLLTLFRELKGLKDSRLDELMKQFEGLGLPEIDKATSKKGKEAERTNYSVRVEETGSDVDPKHLDIVNRHLKNLRAELEEHAAGISINAEITVMEGA